ncbi:MAG TPA: acetate kinase, partial [Ruminococcaceae bacterium]|nr:acetate kinase [Oscillospiraceae bacterium]
MKVLVINAGSSSLKYQLFDMANETVLAKGNCERIGIGGLITHKTFDGKTISYEAAFPTHKEAFMEVVSVLTKGEGKVIDDVSEISAVGHRVLHGAELYKESTLITDKVIEDIVNFSELGPLHNPPQALAMKASQEVFGKQTPMVAIFDTSFHQTMPEKAYMFAIPYEYYEKYHIRRYGFHGTSHRYVSAKYFEVTGKQKQGSRIITCHLGNGSSISAVKDGKCFDTSMGFTPLDGFIMGTRSGGIDPSVVTYIANKEGMTPDQMSDMLNKKSGFLGVSGVSSDCRDLHAAAKQGNHRAQLALDMLVYQVKKFIGSYAAAMGGTDAIIFTGGIGENDKVIRSRICSEMEFMGAKFDENANNAVSGKPTDISTADSKVKIYVIPTDEELLIAKD